MTAVLLTLLYVGLGWLGLSLVLAVGWAVMRSHQKRAAGGRWSRSRGAWVRSRARH